MLHLVQEPADNRRLQKRLKSILLNVLEFVGERNIGFPGGYMSVATYSEGPERLYFAPSDHRSEYGKFWNAFGFYQPERASQNIAVEINIYEAGLGGAAYFARDPLSGAEFLMHTGRIGGGRKGVGRAAFLAWSEPELLPVLSADSKIYPAVVVAKLDERLLITRLKRFVEQVRDFKQFIKDGGHEARSFQARLNNAVERYSREWSGRRQGRAGSTLDYVSYHGDVVDAIRKDLMTTYGDDVTVSNTVLVDLFARFTKGRPRLYEVKTSCDRQSLYTAIGQLTVHGSDEADATKHLVLPEGELPNDVEAALHAQSIIIDRFAISQDGSTVSFRHGRRRAIL